MHLEVFWYFIYWVILDLILIIILWDSGSGLRGKFIIYLATVSPSVFLDVYPCLLFFFLPYFVLCNLFVLILYINGIIKYILLIFANKMLLRFIFYYLANKVTVVTVIRSSLFLLLNSTDTTVCLSIPLLMDIRWFLVWGSHEYCCWVYFCTGLFEKHVPIPVW